MLERVALQHFARYGLEGASLSEIAKELGITRQALNKRFGSKAALFENVIEEHRTPFLHFDQSTFPGSPFQALQAYTHRLVDEWLSDEGFVIFRIYYTELHRFPELLDAELKAIDRMHGSFGAYLNKVARDIGAPNRDWRVSAQLFFGVMTSYVLPCLLGAPRPSSRQRATYIERALLHFLSGEGLAELIHEASID